MPSSFNCLILIVDCVWNDWAEWQPCNVTCGDGYQLRTRDSVQEMYDGLPCEGSTEDWQSCFPRNCPSKCTEHQLFY